MKKTILIIALLLSAFTGIKAQSVYNNPDNRPRWGVRLGYELACPGDIKFDRLFKGEVLGNGSGFNLGVVYNLPVIYNFYFEPGVTLYYNTYSLNKDFVNAALDEVTETTGLRASSASVRMWGLRLPVIGGYRFDVLDNLGISVFTGPEFALGLSAKSNIKVGSLSLTDSEYGDDGMLNRPDIKWRFGVGATFSDNFHISLSGAVGLCDQAKGDASMHSNLFDITVGYNF